MPSKQVIIEIIAQLTPRQSRVIKDGLRGNRKRLFNFLTPQKEFSTLDAAQVFMGLDDKGFAVLKSQLEKRVLRLLGEMAVKGWPSERIGAVALQAKGYHLFGFQQKAIQHYISAFALALEFEELHLAASMLATIQIYWPRSCPDSMMEANETLRAELHSSQALLRNALAVKSLRGQERLDEARSLLARIIELPIPASKKAKVFHIRARIIGTGILRDYDAVLPLCAEIDSIVCVNTWLHWDSGVLASVINMKIVEVGILFHLKKAEECIHKLDLFKEQLLKQQIPVPAKLMFHQNLMSIEFALKNSDHETVANLIGQLQVELGTSKENERLLSLEFIESVLQIAMIFFKAEEYVKACDWLVRIRKHRMGDGDSHLFVVGAILEVFSLVELGDDNGLDAAIRRADRRFKNAKVPNEFSKPLLEAFRSLFKRDELKDGVYQTLAIRLGKCLKEEKLKLIFDLFPITKWLQK